MAAAAPAFDLHPQRRVSARDRRKLRMRKPHTRGVERKEKNEWLRVVEEETREFRERMARKHELRAMHALEAQEDVHPEPEWDPIDCPWDPATLTEEQYAEFNRLRFEQADRKYERACEVAGTLKYPRGSESLHRFHKTRAQGQRERFLRIGECATSQLRSRCDDCNVLGPVVPFSCDHHRLCFRCRQGRRNKFMTKFRAGQARVREMLWQEKLLTTTLVRNNGGALVPLNGGRWGEKFFTLTLPHSGDIEADVQELPKAWVRFLRLLRAHIAKDILRGHAKHIVRKLLRVVRYCKVLEVTPGEDFKGHAHLHVYLVVPFIDHAMLAHLWGKALSPAYRGNADLRRAEPTADEVSLPTQTVEQAIDSMRGRLTAAGVKPHAQDAMVERFRRCLVTRRNNGKPLKRLYRPVVDVRDTEPDVAAELCKYLVKDADVTKDGRIRLMEPKQFALVYCALEGRRAITASVGFLRRIQPPRPHCPECGGTLKFWIHECKSTLDRGPPSPQLELPL